MLYQFIDLTRQIAKYDFMNMKKKLIMQIRITFMYSYHDKDSFKASRSYFCLFFFFEKKLFE